MAQRGRPPVKGSSMTAQINLRLLPEERDALKGAAALDREDGSLSRWLIELGLRRAKRLGVEIQEPEPPDDDAP